MYVAALRLSIWILPYPIRKAIAKKFSARLSRTLQSVTNIVATKFLPRSQEELDRNVSGQIHVAECLDKSLKRLGLDYVDLYIYHMWDYHTPMEEIIEGLNHAVKAGKTRYIGISNCYARLLGKVTAPVMGVTKKSNIDGAVKAVELELTQEETDYLEELLSLSTKL